MRLRLLAVVGLERLEACRRAIGRRRPSLSGHHLKFAQREEIAWGHSNGLGVCIIARKTSWAASTISVRCAATGQSALAGLSAVR